jgi:ubiquitin fusion degradation protein 1
MEFSTFTGQGQRLSGKSQSVGYGYDRLTRHESLNGEVQKDQEVPAALYLPPGRLYFGYPIVPLKKETKGEDEKTFVGEGQVLRKKKK